VRQQDVQVPEGHAPHGPRRQVRERERRTARASGDFDERGEYGRGTLFHERCQRGFDDAALILRAIHRRLVEESVAVAVPAQQPLLVQPIERRHDRGVREPVADALAHRAHGERALGP